ncbi:MAG: J domain-containing protein, partial [Candidatus Velamenicoccus archaeovorus]
MIEDPYVVLGLPRGASQDQIRAAYRRLAQIYHPDRYQGAPADVRAEAERRMKQVNAAYDALRKGTAASGPTTAPGPTTAGPRPGPEPRHPTAEEQARQEAVNFKGRFCSVCGHAPVANVTLKEGVGFVLFRQVRTVSGDLCRDCGIAMFREAQAGTLLKGWWGFIAFFANVLYVLQNAAARQALGRLAPPRRTPRSRLTPRSRPLVPGRPVWQRAGFLLSAGLAVLIVIGTVSNGSTGNGSTSSG